MKLAQKALDIPKANAPAIALVIGYDHRAGIESANPSLSDTLMLIRADPVTKTISLLSFPRDLIVPIYCSAPAPVRPTASTRRTRAAARRARCRRWQAHGPADQLPDHGQLPRLQAGRRQARRRLDGRRPAVLQPEHRLVPEQLREHQPAARVPEAVRPAGARFRPLPPYRRRPPPRRAAAGVRPLLPRAGAARASRRSRSRASSTRSRATSRSPRAGTSSRASRSTTTRSSRTACRPGMSSRTRSTTSSAAYGCSASQDEIQKAVQDFSNPDVESSKAANAAALGRKLKQKAPPVSSVTLTVLNGNGVAGVAPTRSYLLGQRGYKVLTPPNNLEPNAPRQDYFHTMIYYDKTTGAVEGGRDRAAGDDAARRRRAAAGDARALRALDPGSMLLVVLGTAFHGSLGATTTKPAPKHQAAYVRYDASQGTSLLQPLAKKVKFKLMVPTVLERNSYPDTLPSDKPVRALLHRQAPQGRAARVPHGRRRVLGHPGDGLRGCAGARRQELPARPRRAVSSTSTTTGRSCTWSCSVRARRATGSSTRCSTRSRTRRCWRSPRA